MSATAAGKQAGILGSPSPFWKAYQVIPELTFEQMGILHERLIECMAEKEPKAKRTRKKSTNAE